MFSEFDGCSYSSSLDKVINNFKNNNLTNKQEEETIFDNDMTESKYYTQSNKDKDNNK